MKKFIFVSALMLILVLAGCGNNSDNQGKENNGTETEPEENSTLEENNVEDIENNGASEETGGNNVEEKGELKLQLLKQDEEDGLTFDNSDIYQEVKEEVEANPLMGDANDLSLYPYDIVEFEDGSQSLLFLVINRLEDPIRNLIFNLTFGNQDGDYIFDGVRVDLPEDYLGVLEKDGVVPMMVDLEDEEDEAIFESLTQENVYLELKDVGIDYAD